MAIKFLSYLTVSAALFGAIFALLGQSAANALK